MVLVDFNPCRVDFAPLTTVEHPYFRAVIDAKDHSQIYNSKLASWSQSTPFYIWNYPTGSTQWIGLSGNLAVGSGTLSKTMSIEESGLYQVKVRVLANNWVGTGLPHDKFLTLKVDGVQKGDSINLDSPWISERYVDFGVHTIQAGSRVFSLEFASKDVWAHEIILYKINRFTTDSKHSRDRLDIKTATFTQNTVTELNTCNLDLYMPDDWFVPEKNDNSRLVFDITDSLTLYLGETRKKARAMFGGYVIGYAMSENNDTLTLNHIDTLLDLYRKPVYANYYMGIAPTEGHTFQDLQFSTLFEAVRHLCLTQPYYINPVGLSYPYGFKKNFGRYEDFLTISSQGFLKTYDKRNGYPAPGMRIGYDSVPSHCISDTYAGYVNLYTVDDSLGMPYDAAVYNILSFNYMAANKDVDPDKNMQFNIKVNMHKDGLTPEEAVDYYILFTGKAGHPNVIGSVYPKLDGGWQVFKFDLKAALDKYANSAHYYINRIDLVDNITTNQVNNRLAATMWIDNPMAYDTTVNAKFSVEQESAYPFEVLKAICDSANYTAWMQYGPQRKDDALYMAPENNEATPESISQGVNVLKVYNKNYAPKETIANKVVRHWDYNEVTGKAYSIDELSLTRYGPFENFNTLSGVTNQLDATIEAQRYLEMNSSGLVTYSLDILGSTLLNPAQYVVTDIPGEYLSGPGTIKSIIHTMSVEAGFFKTQIDVGATSRRFNFMMVNLRKQMRSLMSYDNRTQYNTKAMARLGFTSPGGFIKTR